MLRVCSLYIDKHTLVTKELTLLFDWLKQLGILAPTKTNLYHLEKETFSVKSILLMTVTGIATAEVVSTRTPAAGFPT